MLRIVGQACNDPRVESPNPPIGDSQRGTNICRWGFRCNAQLPVRHCRKPLGLSAMTSVDARESVLLERQLRVERGPLWVESGLYPASCEGVAIQERSIQAYIFQQPPRHLADSEIGDSFFDFSKK